MKLTAQEIYDKLILEDKIKTVHLCGTADRECGQDIFEKLLRRAS